MVSCYRISSSFPAGKTHSSIQKFLSVSRHVTHHFFSLNFFCSCYSSNLCDLFHRLVQSSCFGRVSQLGAVTQQISSVQLYLLCKCCLLKYQVRLVSQFVLDMTVPSNHLSCSFTFFLDTTNNTHVLREYSRVLNILSLSNHSGQKPYYI